MLCPCLPARTGAGVPGDNKYVAKFYRYWRLRKMATAAPCGIILQEDAKRLTSRMADQVEKEAQRLLGFAREHARAALAKPETQRESYLAFCRLNFKRYAAGISRSPAEAERFASALDRATRDLMIEIQNAATAVEAVALSPWYPLRDDAVE